MSVFPVLSDALLGLGCACMVLACVGTAVVPNVYDRLHFVAVAATIGAPLLVTALAVAASSWRSALKLLLIAALLAATGPATAAVTARAGARETGEADQE